MSPLPPPVAILVEVVFIAAVVIFFKITTPQEREYVGWSIVTVLAIAFVGVSIYNVITTGSLQWSYDSPY